VIDTGSPLKYSLSEATKPLNEEESNNNNDSQPQSQQMTPQKESSSNLVQRIPSRSSVLNSNGTNNKELERIGSLPNSPLLNGSGVAGMGMNNNGSGSNSQRSSSIVSPSQNVALLNSSSNSSTARNSMIALVDLENEH